MSGSAIYAGVSGMGAQQQRMDVIANDIANMNTTGYKESVVSFQEALVDTIAAPAINTPGRQLGLGVRMGMTTRNFGGGALTETGISSQLAIQGQGFFVVQATDAAGALTGSQYYTRAGDFTMNVRDANTVNLMTSGGYTLLANDGTAINLRNGVPAGVDVTSFNVLQNGTITSFGSDGLTYAVGTIPVVRFMNNNGLSAVGNTLFKWTEAASPTQPTLVGAANSTDINIIQGYTESSNVDLTKEFSELIITQRGFQANSKTITTADEMMQTVLGLKR
jgi:flagellar hook protein FlgE